MNYRMTKSEGTDGRDRARQSRGVTLGIGTRVRKGEKERKGRRCSGSLPGVCPPPPHLADEGELPYPDVVPIQPQGEDGS